MSLPASGSVIARLATHSPAAMAGRYWAYFMVCSIFILVWNTAEKSLT